jgi:hypothetical protein
MEVWPPRSWERLDVDVDEGVWGGGRVYPDVEVEVAVGHRSGGLDQLMDGAVVNRAAYSTLNPIVGIVVTTSPICLGASDG